MKHKYTIAKKHIKTMTYDSINDKKMELFIN